MIVGFLTFRYPCVLYNAVQLYKFVIQHLYFVRLFRFIKEVHPAAVVENMGNRLSVLSTGRSTRKRDSSALTATENYNSNPMANIPDNDGNESILTDRKSSVMMRTIKPDGSESFA